MMAPRAQIGSGSIWEDENEEEEEGTSWCAEVIGQMLGAVPDGKVL